MPPGPERKGGSFGDLRDRHLLLFGGAEHRHDRGWPHPPRKSAGAAARRTWKTAGIVHFRDDDDVDG